MEGEERKKKKMVLYEYCWSTVHSTVSIYQELDILECYAGEINIYIGFSLLKLIRGKGLLN